MQVTMLVRAIKKSVPYNLRRIAAYTAYKNKTLIKTKFACCKESDLLSTSFPNYVGCRIYSTGPDSESPIILPMLVDGAPQYIPSLLTPLKLFYLSVYRITPHIDKEFDVVEFIKGARYATTVISNALTNKNYEALEGLVTKEMIETLKTKIETLSPNQRQLIAVNDDDIFFYALSDIAATIGDEHSIEITTTCHYIQDLRKKKESIMNNKFVDFYLSKANLVCNYIFTRKYVNNVGGPWITTFVNHYTM